MKKKELALLLSQLEPLSNQEAQLEQYQTEGDIAANFLWDVYMQGNIEEKEVADLGCGNGILGIGALLLGAKKVHFVDSDKKAIQTAKKNKQFIEKNMGIKLNATFTQKDVRTFKKTVDVVVQNPPFGVQTANADRHFLLAAMQIAPLIYSFHKIESKQFIKALTKDHGFKVIKMTEIRFPLKKTQAYHKKKTYTVQVGIWQIERFKNSL
tara:strand:+ start:3536 stop:4165 length:630 start_codon:yes stop_codon:yes gene_type:complete